MRPRRLLLIALGLVVIAWALVPAARGALLVRHGGSPFSANMSGYPAEQVSFAASDGVRLNGTLVPAPAATGTVILVHGFKSGRGEMLDWLAFLHPTYSVLLYDGRGVGSSDGVFGVGATEDRDILGAVDFIQRRRAAGWDRVAVLGISLGAGDAILAGARDERIRAVVADSPWIDEFVQLERMHSLPIGPVAVPLLPYEPALVDALLGGRLEDARLVTVVDKIAPRSVGACSHSLRRRSAEPGPDRACAHRPGHGRRRGRTARERGAGARESSGRARSPARPSPSHLAVARALAPGDLRPRRPSGTTGSSRSARATGSARRAGNRAAVANSTARVAP